MIARALVVVAGCALVVAARALVVVAAALAAGGCKRLPRRCFENARCADLRSLSRRFRERSGRAFCMRGLVRSGGVGLVGLVDEAVEDLQGVVDGLVVGHRRAGLERGVVALRSVGGTRARYRGSLVSQFVFADGW